MNRPTVCVVKVGGSLLDYELLSDALCRWLDGDQQKHYILVAGGGPWADAIRQADREAPLGDEAAHWLCVQAMSTTAELLAGRLKKGDRHPRRFLAQSSWPSGGISATVREPVPVFQYSPLITHV